MPLGIGRRKAVAWEVFLPLENIKVVKDLMHMYLIIYPSRNVK